MRAEETPHSIHSWRRPEVRKARPDRETGRNGKPLGRSQETWTLGPAARAAAHHDVAPSTAREWLRRALNVAVALVGLLLAAPLMIAIAILIKISSPGPVLYRQFRVGLDRRTLFALDGDLKLRRKDRGGRVFTMYKFRTMHDGADRVGEIWARAKDARVTALGRILRRYRLDELPQLFNVLRGDMNIVGPRPEQPKIFAELWPRVDQYALRQRVLPGITGLAQVSRPYDRTVMDVRAKVKLDLDYLGRRSPAEDVRIMLLTVPVMFGGRGSMPDTHDTSRDHPETTLRTNGAVAPGDAGEESTENQLRIS